MRKARDFRKSWIGLSGAALAAMLLVGCEITTEDGNNAPQLTMDLPLTLQGTVSQPGAAPLTVGAVSDINQCANYYDANAADNWMDNAYSMTRFLVGMSQAQSCIMDFFIDAMLQGADSYANTGAIILDNTDSSSPTHLRYDVEGATYQLWIYFASAYANQELPADTSDIYAFYLTWSGDAETANGRFIAANMPGTDPEAPSDMRVDFVRSATVDTNQLYFAFKPEHTHNVTNWRVDVTATESGDTESYLAKGYMAFDGQPLSSLLPTTEDFGVPNITMVAFADGTGAGAAVSDFADVAIHLAEDIGNDGVYGSGEYTFGSYKYTLEDRGYFDVQGSLTWRYKQVSNAVYVDNGDNTADNQRVAANLSDMYTQLEDVNKTDEVYPGYFTDSSKGCPDTNGANCTAFIQLLYDEGVLNSGVQNSSTAEPNDARRALLDQAVPLDRALPDNENDGSLVFVIPAN